MKISNKELIDILPLAYYGTKIYHEGSKPIINLSKLSYVLSISTSKILSALKKISKYKSFAFINRRGRMPKLNQYHINFLCSERTLIKWAGFSIRERVQLFHRQYPEMRISYSYLQRFYKKYKIKFKVIRQKKLTCKIPEIRLTQLTNDMKEEVKTCLEENIKIIFVDEAIFSPQTMLARSWSKKYQNIEQLDLRYTLETQALVCGISQDKGLEAYCIWPFSINAGSFIDFLHQLRHTQGNDDYIAIFMDNLAVHKTQKVKEVMEELNMISIFSVPYSPQYNGIESYFFLVKQQYKKMLLQKTIKEEDLDIRNMMEDSIRKIEDSKTKNCCLGSVKIILHQD